MEYLKYLDRQLFASLNGLGSPRWDWFWLTLSDKWVWIPLYALLIGLLYKQVKLRKTIVTLLFVALLITCTDQLASLSKAYFQRVRPCCNILIRGRMLDVGGLYGFFSAHAESTMALAVFIGIVLKSTYKYSLVSLIGWSLLVGYSRVYVGDHFPGDVLVGWLVGALLGGGCYLIWRYTMRKINVQQIDFKSVYLFLFNKES